MWPSVATGMSQPGVWAALVLEVSLSAILDQPGQDAQPDGREDRGTVAFCPVLGPPCDQPLTMLVTEIDALCPTRQPSMLRAS